MGTKLIGNKLELIFSSSELDALRHYVKWLEEAGFSIVSWDDFRNGRCTRVVLEFSGTPEATQKAFLEAKNSYNPEHICITPELLKLVDVIINYLQKEYAGGLSPMENAELFRESYGDFYGCTGQPERAKLMLIALEKVGYFNLTEDIATFLKASLGIK